MLLPWIGVFKDCRRLRLLLHQVADAFVTHPFRGIGQARGYVNGHDGSPTMRKTRTDVQ
jgi:hypothetical protein